ncbi:hypothetical protein [Ruegeria faecimaris]|uniref:hypothetical protein n=1 Tax=Ruegeria faecimaris TaxID=686389 RepID=UPI0011581772|nr:hypothetical protein [Ruegeria faecimaris]
MKVQIHENVADYFSELSCLRDYGKAVVWKLTPANCPDNALERQAWRTVLADIAVVRYRDELFGCRLLSKEGLEGTSLGSDFLALSMSFSTVFVATYAELLRAIATRSFNADVEIQNSFYQSLKHAL